MMKKHWALLTILASLLLGILSPMLFYRRGVSRSIHTMFGCTFLKEAENAGYLDQAKRARLVDDLARSPWLDANARQSVVSMRTGCP